MIFLGVFPTAFITHIITIHVINNISIYRVNKYDILAVQYSYVNNSVSCSYK